MNWVQRKSTQIFQASSAMYWKDKRARANWWYWCLERIRQKNQHTSEATNNVLYFVCATSTRTRSQVQVQVPIGDAANEPLASDEELGEEVVHVERHRAVIIDDERGPDERQLLETLHLVACVHAYHSNFIYSEAHVLRSETRSVDNTEHAIYSCYVRGQSRASWGADCGGA